MIIVSALDVIRCIVHSRMLRHEEITGASLHGKQLSD